MTEWITVKDKKEDQIEKKVENEWIKKKIKPKEKESVWIKKKVKEEKKQDKARVEKTSGGLIKGFPRLATKGFRK